MDFSFDKPRGAMLSGQGAPEIMLGEDGDFYIDIENQTLYGPKNVLWGGGTPLKGKDAEPNMKMVGDSVVFTMPLAQGIKGDKGDSIKGDKGDDGIGIESIDQSGETLNISLSNGVIKQFTIKNGINGKDGKNGIDGLSVKGDKGADGVGVSSIDYNGEKLTFKLTDFSQRSFALPQNKDGREIELRQNGGIIQKRYSGDDDWEDLYSIPNYGVSGGSGIVYLKGLLDINFTSLQNGQTIQYNSAAKKWENVDFPNDAVWGQITGTLSDQTDLQAALDLKIDLSEKGVADGVATLDSGGKVPTSQLPDAILGALIYQGSWNASTNTPTLTSSTGTKGYYYVVSVAGSTNLDGITDWVAGDWAVFNGTIWEKIDNTEIITSVNGQTGVVSLDTDDINEGSTNIYYTDERAQDAVGSMLGDSLVYTDATPLLDTVQDIRSSASPTFAGIFGNATGIQMITDENGDIELNPDGDSINVTLYGFDGSTTLIMGDNIITHQATTSYFTGDAGFGTSTPGSDGGTGYRTSMKDSAQYLLYLASTSASGDTMLGFGQQDTRTAYIQYLDSGDLFRMTNEYGPIVFLTGTGGSESEKLRLTTTGILDFDDAVGDKIQWFSNTYATSISSGTLAHRSATRHRLGIGGTSEAGMTTVFDIDANDTIFSTNVYVSAGHSFIAKTGNGLLGDGDGSACLLDIDFTDVGSDASQSELRVFRDTNASSGGTYPQIMVHRGDGTFNPQFEIDCNTQDVTVHDGDIYALNDLYVGQDIIHNGDSDSYWRFGTNTLDLFLGGVSIFDIASDGIDTDVFVRQIGKKVMPSNVNSVSTTLAQLSNLSESVLGSRTYQFSAYIPFTVTGSGAGVKYAMNGSCSVSAIRYSIKIFNDTTSILAGGSSATLGGSVGVGGNITGFALITGSFTVSVPGTFGVYHAVNAPSGPTVTHLAMAHLNITEAKTT